MIGAGSLLLGLVMAVVFLVWIVGRFRHRGGDVHPEVSAENRDGESKSVAERQSYERHQAARERRPPVDIGDVCRLGVEEFAPHHSGDPRAVGRIEGFVVFVENVPAGVEVTDVIDVKILSFNRGRTSATATYVETA